MNDAQKLAVAEAILEVSEIKSPSIPQMERIANDLVDRLEELTPVTDLVNALAPKIGIGCSVEVAGVVISVTQPQEHSQLEVLPI